MTAKTSFETTRTLARRRGIRLFLSGIIEHMSCTDGEVIRAFRYRDRAVVLLGKDDEDRALLARIEEDSFFVAFVEMVAEGPHIVTVLRQMLAVVPRRRVRAPRSVSTSLSWGQK